jgi:anti-anti-sigma factor
MNRQQRHDAPDLAPGSWHVIPGTGVIVCVHGEIDSLTAPALTACLDQQIGHTVGSAGVEVALTHVTFLDARGITTLLTAAHTARQQGLDLRRVCQINGVTGCR